MEKIKDNEKRENVQISPPSKSWVVRVNDAIDSPRQMSQPFTKVCIYRVPESIMICNRKAYVPLVIKLGPYHQEISVIDQKKVEAVQRMLKSLNIRKEKLIEHIKSLESKIRECYNEAIYSDGDIFSMMLAMDACFVLDFLKPFIVMENCPCSLCVSSKDENPVYSLQLDIVIDIMKMENQIPWFILRDLLELAFDDLAAHLCGLLDQVMYPFCSPSSANGKSTAVCKLMKCIDNDPFHLLDLKRMLITNLLADSTKAWATAFEPDGDSGISNIKWGKWSNNFELPGCCISMLNRLWTTDYHNRPTPRAELLHRAGIKFQPRQIGFERSKFFLPKMVVDDNTESILMNLMAYEECRRRSRCPDATVISHFVCLLNDLIESEKDVAILKDDGIIESYLGSDKEIADIFNRLGKGISVDTDSYRFKFQLAAHQAKTHYYSPWKKPIRRVKEAYCSKPCFFVTILAAFAMLVLTAVQMVYSVKHN